MTFDDPIVFEPLFFERVWGGRTIEAVFGKALPPAVPIGESWEFVDREEAQSLVHSGPLAGKTLHELWTDYRSDVFGSLSDRANGFERFPLLVKILDAQDRLSIQVHPPANVAKEMGGEPKTEMWYIVDSKPDADLFVGLKEGVSREDFEAALKNGKVADVVHRIETKAGDAMFLPSGRLHAIGAGNLIFEIQQNSDTTYRVFDWNRTGLDGKPRELHIDESLKAIDFDDFEPGLQSKQGESIVDCELFNVEEWSLERPRIAREEGKFAIVVPLEGKVGCGSLEFSHGEFFLVPASSSNPELRPLASGTRLLVSSLP